MILTQYRSSHLSIILLWLVAGKGALSLLLAIINDTPKITLALLVIFKVGNSNSDLANRRVNLLAREKCSWLLIALLAFVNSTRSFRLFGASGLFFLGDSSLSQDSMFLMRLLWPPLLILQLLLCWVHFLNLLDVLNLKQLLIYGTFHHFVF